MQNLEGLALSIYLSPFDDNDDDDDNDFLKFDFFFKKKFKTKKLGLKPKNGLFLCKNTPFLLNKLLSRMKLNFILFLKKKSKKKNQLHHRKKIVSGPNFWKKNVWKKNH